jgi:DNA-binding SARP family transcriptional activator
MEFRILGPVRIRTAGQDDAVSGSKQRTMLAALLLANGRALSDEHLSRMLWDTNPPSTATAQIHTYASRIRHRIGVDIPLVRIRTGYQLLAQHVRYDYREFLRLSAEGRSALDAQEFERAADLLNEALALWQGEALADATEHLIMTERPRLEEFRLETLESRIEAELIIGRHRQLVSELTGLVAHHPLREQFRALLMTALYRSDRQADAMSVYLAGRRMLAEELGVEPGLLLARTYQAVLTGEVRTRMPQQLAS